MASISRREWLLAGGATCGVALFGRCPAAESPPEKHGVIVLDDADETNRGKKEYGDSLSVYDSEGALAFRATNLNMCQTLCSSRRIAVNSRLGHIWVAESVGNRLIQFDLNGNLLKEIADVSPWAIAIDPDSDDLWVAISTDHISRGSVSKFDSAGKRLFDYAGLSATDIVFDSQSKALWLGVDRLSKISLDGRTVYSEKVAHYCAASLAYDAKRDLTWAATRRHPDVPASANRLMAFDANGRKYDFDLGSDYAYRIAVNSMAGPVWVVSFGKSVLRFDPEKNERLEYDVPAIAAEVEVGTDNLWVVTKNETIKMTPDGQTPVKIKNPAPTEVAWIATY